MSAPPVDAPEVRTVEAAAVQAAPGAGRRYEPWLILAVVLADQAAKALVRAYIPLHETVPLVPGLLNLVHVRNTGAAFGLMNEIEFPYKPVAVALVAVIALVGIALYAARLDRRERLARLGMALILAGAVGNLIDRVTAGAVVDFVDVVIGGWHFWAFNVADSAITLGVAAVFLDMFGLGKHVSTTV